MTRHTGDHSYNWGVVGRTTVVGLYAFSCSLRMSKYTVPGVMSGTSITIFPLNFFQFPALGLYNGQLLPQAWSLGLELSFYIVPPAIVFLPRIITWAVAVSLGIFLLAYLGLIHPDIYGYRLLPGVLFIFAVGRHLGIGRLL